MEQRGTEDKGAGKDTAEQCAQSDSYTARILAMRVSGMQTSNARQNCVSTAGVSSLRVRMPATE